MSKLRFVCNSRIIDLYKIGKEKDWAEMESKSLSNQIRWGGMQDDSISVAKHCVEVSKIVEDLTGGDLQLSYYALHHEIEEAFGVGDIIHEVKHFIFKKDKTQYDKFTHLLMRQLDLEGIKDPIIKKADLIVGLLEAELLYPGEVTAEFYSYSDAEDIMPLLDKYRDTVQLPMQDRMKDRKEFMARHYALKSLLDYENTGRPRC